MTVDQLVSHFKTQTRAAEKCGFTQSQISNWKKRGRIPALAQLKVQKKTRGTLKADSGII